MTRVLHTGDTHVGYQQYHQPERRADFLAAFEAVIADAIDEDVDAVVHAGDLFHDRRPDLQDLQGVVAGLRELDSAGVPFLAIVGNHEAKRSGQWIDLFAELDLAERLGEEPRTVGDLALYGLDHVPESQREDLDYDFEPYDAEASALVAHGLFTPFDPGEWDAEALLTAATVDFDALLLGDNHDPGVKQLGDTWVTYPGSTERASAAERTERGYNLVSVEDDGDLRIARRTIETREFAFVDVDLAADEGADVVRERVREHDLEDAVAIVTVEGDGEPITPGPIEELAADRGALVARVNDRRDVETDEADLDVQFADPDDAVRERLRRMGLSGAARDVDRVVRDPDVADSNVRESVRRRVREHREEGLDAFESADGVDDGDVDDEAPGDDGTHGDAEYSGDGESSGDASHADDGAQVDPESVSAESGDAESDGVDSDGSESRVDGSTAGKSSDDASDDDGSGAEQDPATDESNDDQQRDGDGQLSMEEYL